MKAAKIIKKRILIETISLLFLIVCIIYSSITIKKSNASTVENNNNFVAVIDDKKYNSELKKLSDGEGLQQDGIIYAVTNNNKKDKTYNILIKPDTEKIDNIKISVDDIYIFNLNELEKKDDYYILFTNTLEAGYTKRHIIKSWYKKIDNIDTEKVKYTIKLDIN